MATDKQKDLFNDLLGKKDLGANNANDLRDKFANLPDKSASAWIEALIARPDAGDVPPPTF